VDSNNSNSFISRCGVLSEYEGPFANVSAATHEEDVLFNLRGCGQSPLPESDSTDDDRTAKFLSPDENLLALLGHFELSR
jgi:hypothetical protein